MLQDFLTAAATATLYGTIGFVVFGYVAYVWHRTAPVAPVAEAAPVAVAPMRAEPPAAPAPSEFLEGDEIAEEGNVCVVEFAPVAAPTPDRSGCGGCPSRTLYPR